MAYADYGAVVFLNGQRRADKEDEPLFFRAEGFIKNKKISKNCEGSIFEKNCHGVLGDGAVRVKCLYASTPVIYEWDENSEKPEVVGYTINNLRSVFDYDPTDFEFHGYRFHFESSDPYFARMIEPNGNVWECKYGDQYSLSTGNRKDGAYV